jgi:predicted nicotinamide N-methyase
VALNAKANGVTPNFTDVNLLDAPPPEVDVICAGDVCYEKPMTERVLAWLAQARKNGTRVLIGDPHRTYFPKEGLEFLAEYRVPTTRELEDFEIKRSSVWAMP